jgi:hypothetical protein
MELAMRMVRGRTMAVSLWLHTDVDPPRDEWDAAMGEFQAHMRATELPPERLRGLVFTDGAAPNARQRNQLRDLTQGARLKISVVTTVLSNPIKQGVATALQWMNPATAFFLPSQTREALAHLDLAGDLRVLWNEALDLQRQLPPVETLRLVAQSHSLMPPPAQQSA